jgi:cytoskeletal protein RodZ
MSLSVDTDFLIEFFCLKRQEKKRKEKKRKEKKRKEKKRKEKKRKEKKKIALLYTLIVNFKVMRLLAVFPLVFFTDLCSLIFH